MTSKLPAISNQEWLEIRQYVSRFERMSAEEILEIMEQLRDFFYEHMTPEGKKFIYEQKHYRIQGLAVSDVQKP